VPAGSVAIAGSQTCVYPRSTPGGWRLLGRCPLRLFDLDWSPPVAYGPSDVIRFEPIEEADYLNLLANPRMPVGELIADE
jgi:allophanate hydrolase subunit 1